MSTRDASRYRCDWTRAAVIPPLVVLGVALSLSCAMAAEPPTPAAGGKYFEFSVDDSLATLPAGVARALKAGTFAPDQQKVFTDYFNGYALPRWSREADIAMLPRYRDRELRRQLWQAGAGPVHDHLVSLVFQQMRAMVNHEPQQCHPATRYNAMLMIGYLNATEAPRSGQPPVPHPDALPDLLKAVAPGANDPRLPAEVRSAALTGLIRHARIGIPADQRAAVSGAMLPLVRAATVPGPEGEGQAWMRGQAAEVLGWLRSVGQAGAVASALTGMVADAGLPFSARCKAAEALGKLNYTGAQTDIKAMTTALGQLALDACNAEKAAADNAADDGKGPYRRRLLQSVNAALAGVDGLARPGSPPAKLKGLQTVLKEMQEAVSAKSLDNAQLITSMTPSYEKLTKLFP